MISTDLIMTKLDLVFVSILKRASNEQFEMSDLDFYTFYLDMMIFKERKLRKLILDQSVYVKQVLRDHEIWNCKWLIIFMNFFCRLIKAFDEYTVDKNFETNYQLTMRFFMYIMLNIKSNKIYFIFVISLYVFNSIQTYWQAIK